MSLRTKLLLGYLLFVAALLSVGAWSAWRLRPPSLIHTITTNGFEIVRQTQTSTLEAVAASKRHFMVKNPRGWEREVVIEIPDEVVAHVEHMTRRELPAENSFWTHRAERTLAT